MKQKIQEGKYTLLQGKLRKILVEFDPPGLIQGGAPEDEYDGEISRIMPKLMKAKNLEEVVEAIYEVFYDSLGESAGVRSRYEKVAEEIHTFKESLS